MLIPLMILAVLSIVGGWVGVPEAMSGANHFERFLAPVFHSTTPSAELEQTGATDGHGLTEEAEQKTSSTTERLFAGISVAGAFFGLYLAWLLYLRRPQLPQKIARSLNGFYDMVLHKYYVDEFYATIFVKPLIDGSRTILWHGIDQGVIDATVDKSAEEALEVSDGVRHMESGNVRSYASWVAIGAAAVIAYMIWVASR
jgi:NADH-quinone oxidoreductase subunit L